MSNEEIVGALIRQLEGHDIISMDMHRDYYEVWGEKWRNYTDTGRREITFVLQKRVETQKTQNADVDD